MIYLGSVDGVLPNATEIVLTVPFATDQTIKTVALSSDGVAIWNVMLNGDTLLRSRTTAGKVSRSFEHINVDVVASDILTVVIVNTGDDSADYSARLETWSDD